MATASGGAPVILDEERHDLQVIGHGIIRKPKHRSLCAPNSVVAVSDLASLAEAIRDPDRCCASLPEEILIAEGPDEEFDEDFFEPGPVSLEIGPETISALCSVLVGPDRGTREDYAAWLKPAASRHHCRIAEVRVVDEYGSEDPFAELPLSEAELDSLREEDARRPKYLEIRIAAAKPMLSGDLLAAGREVHALASALRGGQLSAVSARDLLLARLPHLLIGLPESQWLEAKSHPYALNSPDKTARTAAKIELAQDVAGIGNGGVDGILVVGLETGVLRERDVVRRVKPAKLSAISPRQYLDVIDSRVYPSVEGIEADRVDLDEHRGLLVIHIPPQPAASHPFLVKGAVVSGRVEEMFISIGRRRGDKITPVTPSQIHSMLVAGRAVLEDRWPNSKR